MQSRSRIVRGLRRAVAVLAIGAFLPLSTAACFGKFELTRKVYSFNQDVSENKWAQWFAFLGLSIFPVYLLAGLMDVLLGNSFEFWTGDNPLLAYGPNGEVLTATPLGPGLLALELREADGAVRRVTLRAEGDSAVALDADENVLARVRDVDGRATLVE